MTSKRMGLGRGIILTLVLLPAAGLDLHAQVAPSESYRALKTEHFRVIFPERLEPFARRAAARAEWAYEALSTHFIEPPSGRIALIITDDSDRPNASATPIPSNRITLIATPHIANRQLNYSSDWLDVALVHELTHIFHMDRATGVWTPFRKIFGRSPVFFPAFYQPRWVIEGLPTYYESRLTGAGRAYGSYFDMLLTGAALQGDFLPVDAADGFVPNWPADQAPYAYGGRFFRFLAEEHGDAAIAQFARRGAARLPYTLDWAGKPHFGSTLSGRWSEWRSEFAAEAGGLLDRYPASLATKGEPLSDFVWIVPSPRYSPDARYLAYNYIEPRAEAATAIVDSRNGTVVRRSRRNSSGGNTWSRDGTTVYFQQNELVDRYRVYGDLYALDLNSGRQRRLTVRERLADPDLAMDGRTLIAVQVGNGTNRLVSFDLESSTLTPLTEFVDSISWLRPRWSPNGKQIAAERWVRGRVLDVVVIDRDGRLARELTKDEALDIAPAWSPDGRYVLWASDRSGSFEIYAADLKAGAADLEPRVWRVTHTLSGALDPAVSPDGRWLAYAAQYSRGFRLERIAFDSAAWQPAGPTLQTLHQPAESINDVFGPIDGPTRAYSPFPSLWPKSWLPLAAFSSDSETGDFFGATVFGTDDVRRHAYALLAGWRTGVEDLEGIGAYIYRGLGDPVLQLTASQDWDPVLLRTMADTVVRVVERDREVSLAASFVRPRARNVLSLTPVIGVEELRYSADDTSIAFADPAIVDLEGSLLIGFSTARGYPRSVSAERGWITTLKLSHERLADDLDRWRVSAEAVIRGYTSFSLFGYANHVLAARAAFGASDGRQRPAELFDLGGTPGQALDFGLGLELGGGETYHVRGFDAGSRFGDRIAAASLEYRFPLLLIGRGYKLWPILLDRLSGSLFLDAGSAWFDSSEIEVLGSMGSEVSIDVNVGYAIRYRFRTGVARRVATPGTLTSGWSGYVTAGVAF